MSRRLNFTPGSSAEQQLLAVGLVLLRMLRSHSHLELKMPREVHEQLTRQHYGALLYDILAAEHPLPDERLRLCVHQAGYFEILSRKPETSHALT